MNLEEIRDRVRRVSGFTMPELYPDPELVTLIGEVYLDVCGSADWPFLYVQDTVTLDAAEVALPSTLRLVTSVDLGDGDRLHATVLDELIRLDDKEGQPTAYAHKDASTLVVYPTPDEDYTATVRGYLEVDPLAAGESPVFDREFHPVLVYETASRLLSEFGGDQERVESFREEAQAGLSRMRVRYLAAKDGGRIQMGGRRNRRQRWSF